MPVGAIASVVSWLALVKVVYSSLATALVVAGGSKTGRVPAQGPKAKRYGLICPIWWRESEEIRRGVSCWTWC
jgi:hypothetical protein